MRFTEDLYYGNIQPSELPPYDSKKCRSALRAFSECEEKLTKTLSENEKKLLLQLIDAHEILILEACTGNFAKGCRFILELLHDCFREEWQEN